MNQIFLPIDSWGRLPRGESLSLPIKCRLERVPSPPQGISLLPRGMGRSYGDSCVNHGHAVCPTRALNHLIAFDPETGVLRAEAGVTLDDILLFAIPRGWFLPTTPGTKFVTLGGALANDVHGKNHHRAGSFGHHVRSFELLRSDGTRIECSPTTNANWFRATIGGLGLTGLITWVEFGLRRVDSSMIDVVSTKFGHVDDFFAINTDAENRHEHTVAWIDCLSSGRNLGRGIYMAGDHAKEGGLMIHDRPRATMPADAPNQALNHFSVRAFNFAYYHRQLRAVSRSRQHYGTFFYPLDAVKDWNRIYGRRGFYQYQSVVPMEVGPEATKEMLKRVARSGQASFLAVLKTFGDAEPAGLLSFPRRGVTLAMDFPNNGMLTLDLFDELDAIVREAGGRLYPAKDARMSADTFRRDYPDHEKLAAFRDPGFCSSFWRRVANNA